jgi:hypothetical protein
LSTPRATIFKAGNGLCNAFASSQGGAHPHVALLVHFGRMQFSDPGLKVRRSHWIDAIALDASKLGAAGGIEVPEMQELEVLMTHRRRRLFGHDADATSGASLSLTVTDVAVGLGQRCNIECLNFEAVCLVRFQ